MKNRLINNNLKQW